ncbi:hypothetical protein [Fructobacillus tropaeoli]|uniref:Uncharacterized protein n=1 Tax=Fructobacillus tropaeoli TaxID=709323 RepID=A0ABN9YRR8_9LACO|nr:unnamed protein product [Fructobacillus tropaeoli]
MTKRWTTGLFLAVGETKALNAQCGTPIFAIDEGKRTFKVINKEGLTELLEQLRREANND